METTETKHTDSKLHFGTRNIEFRLLVFENELIGDAMVFPRSIKSENTYFNYIFYQIFGVGGKLSAIMKHFNSEKCKRENTCFGGTNNP